MHVQVFGAAGEVTGSCYLITTSRARVLVDLGLHQGEKEADEHNRRLPEGGLKDLSAVVLTHAHIDHSGRLPLLAAAGYKGQIYATGPTRDLCEILLRDSARLQAADAERRARREPGARAPEPLYDESHVEPTLRMFVTQPLEQSREVAPGVWVRFVDSGHMLGSASLIVRVQDDGATRTIVFSGDVGPRGMPLLNDPVIPAPSDGSTPDVVFVESTYGDRDHRPFQQTVAEVCEVFQQAVWSKERVLVPAFAVGRAQLVIYLLAQLVDSGKIPRVPVYLDSPMAIAAMRLYKRYASQLDHAMNSPQAGGKNGLDYPELRLCESGDDSRALNGIEGPLVIIAGSGMCNGGRIMHHLRHHVWKKDTHVLIAGYQAENTLGRRLVMGVPEVRIFGETIPVRAKVHTVGGLSAHAGQTELVDWARRVSGGGAKPPALVLTHGENAPRAALAAKIESTLNIRPSLPEYGGVIPL